MAVREYDILLLLTINHFIYVSAADLTVFFLLSDNVVIIKKGFYLHYSRLKRNYGQLLVREVTNLGFSLPVNTSHIVTVHLRWYNMIKRDS